MRVTGCERTSCPTVIVWDWSVFTAGALYAETEGKRRRGWSYLNEDPNVISTNPSPIVSPQLNKDKLQLFPQVTRQAHSEVLFNYGATLFNSTRLLNSDDESRKLLMHFAVLSSPTFCAETASSFPEDLSYSLCLPLFSSLLFGYVTASHTSRIQIRFACFLTWAVRLHACIYKTANKMQTCV